MPRKRTGYDAACYYDGKLLGRCTKADSERLRRGRRPCPAGIRLLFPGAEDHLGKGGSHAGGPEPDGRDVPFAPDLPVGRGAEL